MLPMLAAACVPAPRDRPPDRPRTGSPRPTQRPVESAASVRACLADLTKAGARYELLPDRWFGNGCSATGAVKLVAIGVPVANLGAIKCRTAERLTAWINEALQNAAMAWLDTRVVKVDSFGTYACRPVNNVAGAKLSEHASANAVDIAAFTLADGRRITVKEGWNGRDENVRQFLRAAHKAACRRFGVVIGPDGDRFHHDHFHMDMGNGPYCR